MAERKLMRRVLLESPYGSDDPLVTQRNIRYARACVRDCLLRGDSPMASHLLFTQSGILDDSIEAQRTLGIEAGLAWGSAAEATIVYIDLGITPGMIIGINHAGEERRRLEFRELRGEWSTAKENLQ